ncbi:MAG: metal ABC transporter solute-binding protein, Zn/Mn family [Romboutsia sp.]|uniref:metal ABC transporter solute-binding protein, Zn/Mn family n=1 Tax=Romboutsia sp. TaxID=1965302 RepID=UPI003F2B72ED
MKKIYLLLISLLIGINIIGCSKVQKQVNNDDKPIVYTTIFPIYDFTKNIGRDKIDLNYIIQPGTEPHDYEITPKSMKDIQNADLLIKNGLGIDSFADKIQSESDLNIVVASEGIEPLSYSEDHLHNHENESEHNHGNYDPHIWLDVDLAIKECENIKNALIEVDEGNKTYYENNYNEYIKILKQLQSKYDKELSNLKNKKIIVSHDAYGYLCKKYNVEQVSVTGITPNQEPSLSKISEITNFSKKNNIGYILFDGLVNPKVAQTIANEANIKTDILYSIDGVTKDDFDNNEDYISLMNKNLETLKLVLK